MVIPAIRRTWTVDEVRTLQDEARPWARYELIAGRLLVTPGPAGIHQVAVTEIWRTLDDFVDRLHIGIALTSPADLELRPDSILQPDVFVVPANTIVAGDYLQWREVKSLLLAVEIVSPSSARTDRREKREFYLANHVAEYWLVDTDARTVERWTSGSNHGDVITDRLRWTPAFVPSEVAAADATLEISLPELFDRIQRKARLLAR